MSYYRNRRALGDTSYEQYQAAGNPPCASNQYFDGTKEGGACVTFSGGTPISSSSPATPPQTSNIGGVLTALLGGGRPATPMYPVAPQSTIMGIPSTVFLVGAVGIGLLIALR